MKINNNLNQGYDIGDVIVDSNDDMYMVFENKYISEKAEFNYGFLKVNGDEQLIYVSDFEELDDAIEDFVDYLGFRAEVVRIVPGDRLSLNLD